MADPHRHIFLQGSGEASDFTTPPSGGGHPTTPERDPAQHGAQLLLALHAAHEEAVAARQLRMEDALPVRTGDYLEFSSAPGSDLVTKSLEDMRCGVRLLNVRKDPNSGITQATVHVPAGKDDHFPEKVRRYAEETTEHGRPKHAELVSSVETIGLAGLEAFWTDAAYLLPEDEALWCEVWLSSDRDDAEVSFRIIAEQTGVAVGASALRFPERTVVLAQASRSQLRDLTAASDDIAELRRAKEAARFFLGQINRDQTDWANELSARLSTNPQPAVAVAVLDSGANNGHVLLASILADADCHTVLPEWGVDDHKGHGTLMCGIAGYGDVQAALESTSEVQIAHCLEAVKIVPAHGANPPRLYGHITMQAVSRVEIEAPDRAHIACMAVTSEDGRDRGRPSSWSAAIDQLTSGYADDERRLFIVAAGNTESQVAWSDYPAGVVSNSIHDPGQAWNAVTVGAYTRKCVLTAPDLQDHEPVAPPGALSPYSSTSSTWDDSTWPAKPDILMEGGNVARAPDGFISRHDDLSVVSTGHEPTQRQFDNIEATSAATAQAAWMAACIQDAYPEAWPETVRGLLVHSADWTGAMRGQFLPAAAGKAHYAALLRICGYGVPDLDRATACYNNSLTLVAQEYLQPFDRHDAASTGYRTKDMHLHDLPWPRDVLLDLGATEVSLRITLSYFVEPAPGEVGWQNRYRYASHALRFDLNNVDEDRDLFLKRINAAEREEGEKPQTGSGTGRWLIGPQGRNKGSIHSDIWTGTAAELATCNLIGVYPVVGWWRERHSLSRWGRQTRYSLIVSLHTPEQEVDIYTPVANMVGIPIAT